MDTPWGDSAALSEERLKPGRSNTFSSVAESQRRRLFAALVARVADHDYTEIRVADLCADSGVSSRSFYRLFPDKDACLAAALDSILEKTLSFVIADGDGTGTPENAAEGGIERLTAVVVAQPAAARLCLLDCFTAGPVAVRALDRATDLAEGQLLQILRRSPQWANLSPELLRAAVGALVEIARLRVMRGEFDVLPALGRELFAFLTKYELPTRQLRSAPRPRRPRAEEDEAFDHAERALRAFEALVAERGFSEVTMPKVAKRAGMSVRTLYANFDGLEELMLAAIDNAASILLASALPAARRKSDPGDGLRSAIGAMFSLLASRPNLANLLLVGVYEGGAGTISRRETELSPLRSLLLGVYAPRLWTLPGIAVEAVLGAILTLSRRRLLKGGASSLLGLAPLATYLALFPIVGAEEATRAAEGKTYRRAPIVVSSMIEATERFDTYRIVVVLAQEPASSPQIAERASMSLPEVDAAIAHLESAGSLESFVDSDGTVLYRTPWHFVGAEEWARRPQSEREQISLLIGRVCQEEIERAVDGHTFDSRPERHLSRIPSWVDAKGFAELNELLDKTLKACFEIQGRAVERIKDGADAFPARALLTLFEMPKPP